MPPRKGKEKPIFKGLVIAVAGQLGGQWTDTNISRWVTLRDGVFSPDMNDSVTHLMCSKEEFKERGPRVREALGRGYKKCKVVTADWIEDCLTKSRRLPERQYSLDEKLKKERAKERKEKIIAKGNELAERAVNTNLYHPYYDRRFFCYEITIYREEGERYIMTLYESNALPHLYWFCAKHLSCKGDTQPKFWRPTDSSGRFEEQFQLWQTFFKKKTGIQWDRRLIDPPMTGPIGNVYFRYDPPKGGKPVGCVPEEFAVTDGGMTRQQPQIEATKNTMEPSTKDKALTVTAHAPAPTEEAVSEDYETAPEDQNTPTPPENTPAEQTQEGYQVVFIPERDGEVPVEDGISGSSEMGEKHEKEAPLTLVTSDIAPQYA